MSDLGEEFLGALYHTLLQSRFGSGFVMIRAGAVVGFSFGRSSHEQSLAVVAVRGWRRLLVPVLKLAVQRPIRLLRAVAGLRQPGHVAFEPGIGELMSIAVAHEARGGEASRMIADLLFERLKQEGCRTVRWETLDQNNRAQRYYAKLGGRLIEEIRVRRDRVLWFEKELRR